MCRYKKTDANFASRCNKSRAKNVIRISKSGMVFVNREV